MKLDTTDTTPATGDEPAIEDGTRETLRESVSRALENYFAQMDGETVSDLYQMVLAEVEAPLLRAVMHNTRSNQTRAAEMLGLNRGTLRKKLKQYGML